MLSNAFVAALVASCFVLTLVFQLNPTLPFDPLRVWPTAVAIGSFYAALFAVLIYVVLVAYQLLSREIFSPGWLSVGVLTWLSAAAAAGVATLMWGNLWAFEPVLRPDAARRMANGALILVMCAALFVFVAVLRTHLGPAGRRVWSATFALIMAGAIVAPMALRGPATSVFSEPRAFEGGLRPTVTGRASHLSLIAIDGASLDFITRATAEGRLPNFGRLLDAGAVLRLSTLRPTSPEAVWTAAATGKLPQKNGVHSAGSYRLPRGHDPIQLLPDYCLSHMLIRLGFLVEQPHTSTTLLARTLWDILGELGISAGVVGWPLTYPATPVLGFIVSDALHQLVAMPSSALERAAVYPPDMQQEAIEAAESVRSDESPALLPGLAARHEAAWRVDHMYERIARELRASHPTQIALSRYQSLDAIGHFFLRYATPSEFGDVSDEERRRLGSVLEQHYGLMDEAIGRAMSLLGPDDLLLVVSGFGMEPMGLLKRLLEQVAGDPELSGTHEGAPDGFLMAYGGPVARGRFSTRASVTDVTPTVLYFLGLPIGRDMDGQARTVLFQPSFTAERPITYIPSYERSQ